MSAPVKSEELLISLVAELIGTAKHVAVGAASPIPAAAALVARTRSDGAMRVSLLSSRRHNFFTDGGRELFDCAGQGRIDVFFLSGGQIDGQANVNLVALGDYAKPSVRFPGSFGSAYLYFVIPRVILFRLEHSRRTLVEHVDFISAPGTSPPNVYRPGGPMALVTELCRFDFDRARARFRLASVHPGHSIEEIRDQTGFDFDIPAEVPETTLPDAATLALIRGPIAREVAEVYPSFAARIFGITAPVSSSGDTAS
jgi:glutaconate CoA-transferase subunit B